MKGGCLCVVFSVRIVCIRAFSRFVRRGIVFFCGLRRVIVVICGGLVIMTNFPHDRYLILRDMCPASCRVPLMIAVQTTWAFTRALGWPADAASMLIFGFFRMLLSEVR